MNKKLLPVFQEGTPGGASVLSKPMAMEVDNEDSLDAPPSVGSADIPVTSTPSTKKVRVCRADLCCIDCLIVPISVFQVKGPSKKSVTPYILFSSETRKVYTEKHKNCSFGEISRIVGDKVIEQ